MGDVVRLLAAAAHGPAQREGAVYRAVADSAQRDSENRDAGAGLDRVLLDEQHGGQRAERPADDVGPVGHVEVPGEERSELARPLRAVIHCPSILGIARVGDRVSRLQQPLPELHDPGRDVHRRGVRQRHRLHRRIDEAVSVDDQVPVPAVGEKKRILRLVVLADHLPLRGRRVGGEGGAGSPEDQRQYRNHDPEPSHLAPPLAGASPIRVASRTRAMRRSEDFTLVSIIAADGDRDLVDLGTRTEV